MHSRSLRHAACTPILAGSHKNANAKQLGIFLCMRCASIHRKLGTHISKVKSLSMDSWSNEQVEVIMISWKEEHWARRS